MTESLMQRLAVIEENASYKEQFKKMFEDS